MNCKKTKKCLSFLADGVLDERHTELVLGHLACCESCSREYRKIVSMKRLLGADPSYNSLKYDIVIQPEKRRYTGGFRMKKGLITVCVLMILSIGIFIPINDSSIAQALGIWRKDVSFTAYTYERNDETAEYKVEVYTNRTPDKDDIAGRNAAKRDLAQKTFATIEDARAATGVDFSVPGFIPEGLKLQDVRWSQLKTDTASHGFLLNYTPDGSGKNVLPQSDGANINYVGIAYNIRTDNEKFPGSIYQYEGDADVKEISILGRSGYTVTSVLNGIRRMSIQLDMKEYSLSVGMRVPDDKENDDVLDKMEQELVKITQSIIQ